MAANHRVECLRMFDWILQRVAECEHSPVGMIQIVLRSLLYCDLHTTQQCQLRQKLYQRAAVCASHSAKHIHHHNAINSNQDHLFRPTKHPNTNNPIQNHSLKQLHIHHPPSSHPPLQPSHSLSLRRGLHALYGSSAWKKLAACSVGSAPADPKCVRSHCSGKNDLRSSWPEKPFRLCVASSPCCLNTRNT